MTLAGYSKDRPMVLGQHTPISLAREGGLWKKIPFLKDNDGMLPPYMVVVGDRRRVIAAAMPLSDHIMLQKEVTKAGYDEEHAFKSTMRHVLDSLKSIQKMAQKTGLYTEVADYPYLTLLPALYSPTLSRAIALRGRKKGGERNWYVEMDQLISEIEWLSGPNGMQELFSPNLLSAALLELSEHPPSVGGMKAMHLHAILSRKLCHLADLVLADAGRVNLAIGVFEYKGKPLPLTILETQMGCSAQDINAWEALVNSREDGYMLGKTEVPGRGLAAIRAGTCGGIIIPDGKGGQIEEPFIEIGDAVNARYSLADGATVRQRMGSWSSMNRADMGRFQVSWSQGKAAETNDGKLGGMSLKNRNPGPILAQEHFTADSEWPLVHASPAIVGALSESARELGLTCHEGGNFTKESLYLESDEERVKDLRREYGALSTEMEHFGLAHLTNELTRAGIPATNGLISTVVGTVPGGSFAEPGSKEEEKANESQGKMLEAAMRALWKIAYGG